MHLHQLRPPVPAVLLSVVYAAAIAVALAHPGGHTLAGLVVLAGLVARWAVRSRRPYAVPAAVPLAVAGTAAADVASAPEPAVAPAAA
ncbi:hypothetical protein [Blastococcus goldschmidtiae]|uniref:Uncharacterized protein n=1 Tax=Blastococcus goldschmidtiae TaxID=3075546 RepID=A0ABU2KDD1_9ACTN|nr:hypothetical protein [Blastococcus sp. DSM 46792]MDT0278196.1 hypothetical protein [Blastococcus sp. DSM 46792]